MIDEQQSPRDLCTVELTCRQVTLLLECGYPFSEQEEALRSTKAVRRIHRVKIGAFWIEHVIADLARSMKDPESSAARGARRALRHARIRAGSAE